MVLGLHHIGMLYKEGEQKKKEWRVRNTLPSTVLSTPKFRFQFINAIMKAPKISQNSGISDSVPSKPKWVEHWLNLVDHCISHSGGQFGSFGPIRNVNGRPQNGLKSALLAQMVLFGQRPSEQS